MNQCHTARHQTLAATASTSSASPAEDSSATKAPSMARAGTMSASNDFIGFSIDHARCRRCADGSMVVRWFLLSLVAVQTNRTFTPRNNVAPIGASSHPSKPSRPWYSCL